MSTLLDEVIVVVTSEPVLEVVDVLVTPPELIEVLVPGDPGPAGPKGDPGAGGVATVLSVNGLQGNVDLDYDDVGADAAGTALSAASSALSTHIAHPDPHTQYLETSDVLDGGNF